MAPKKDNNPFLPILKNILRIVPSNPLARTLLQQLQNPANKQFFTGTGQAVRSLSIPKLNKEVSMTVLKPNPNQLTGGSKRQDTSRRSQLGITIMNTPDSGLTTFSNDPNLGKEGRAAIQWAVGDHLETGPRRGANYDMQPSTESRARLYRQTAQGTRRGTGERASPFPYFMQNGKPEQRGLRDGNIWQSQGAGGRLGPQVIFDPRNLKLALEIMEAGVKGVNTGPANPWLQGAMLLNDAIGAATGKTGLEHYNQLTKEQLKAGQVTRPVTLIKP
jgi:hypothetical protein